MKRRFIYMACAVIAAACAPEKEVEFTLDATELNIGPEGGVRTIKVDVDEPWTAMTNEPWIAISPANGKGSEECRVVIDSTLLNDFREDVVRIQTISGDYKEFSVIQEGFPRQICLAKKKIEINDYEPLDNRKFEVNVSTNTDFDVQIPQDVKWLTCKSYEVNLDRGARPRNVKLIFEWNVNPDKERDVEITLLAKEDDVLADKLIVSQGAAPDIEGYAGTPAGDSLALLSINRFLECWTEYDTSVKMSRWEGVTFHKSGENKGRVKSAQFTFFSTKESIPYAVKYLTAAEELTFFSNENSQLYNLSLGEDICELKNLKKLTLFAYGLSELPDKIKEMENLRYLDLSGNNFASIPKVLTECPSLTALFMTANQKTVVTDFSNTVKTDVGGLINETQPDGSGKMKFPQWLLEWNQLDTLRLSVNYLQGELPSDEELLRAGFTAWDVDSQDSWTEEVHLADSLGSVGNTFFRENHIPMVLPNIDFFSFNLNRLSGEIPNWLKYHPKLDFWIPLQLVFPQEGKDRNGVSAGFKDVPTNLNYYYEVYAKKKWSSTNVTE